MGFDPEVFVARCRAALGEPDAPQRIAQLVQAAIAQPDAITAVVRERQAARGKPAMAEVFVNADDLTIYQLAYPPELIGPPHDHAGWAVAGVYAGAEAFNVYQETADGLALRGRQVVAAPSVAVLPPELIHDIENPGATASGSIHVYPNRHFTESKRRIWRDAAHPAEAFSMQKSFAYGMEITNQRRSSLGLGEVDRPEMPEGVGPEAPQPKPRRLKAG